MTTATVRETEAEAVAFIVGQAIGLEMGTASSDYIQMYAGNAALLTESLEVIQRTSAVILGACPSKQPKKSTHNPQRRRLRPPPLITCPADSAIGTVRATLTVFKPLKRRATMTNHAATEYRNVPLTALEESQTNPRRIFDEAALKELADSIRSQGVLSPLLVRPIADHRFEIVAGARRFRAAFIAEAETVPVRIVHLTDAEALEAQLIENLQRRDVHPLEEAQGFRALLNLDEPKYSIEQIAAKTGKSPAYCLQRVKLTELAAAVTEAFAKDEIGIGHALLLAKLQPAEQEQALAACFRSDWNGNQSKARRILLPVRHLKEWIEQNILLILKDAPFSKSDATLNPAAGSCDDCPKRTGANALLFADIAQDACTDPACYQAKLDGFVKQSIAAKPKLVQISSAYNAATDGSAALPRNKYVEIHTEKPTNQKQRDWPEYKTCKYTTEAIVTEGTEKGELRTICANPECTIHHARKQKPATNAAFKAEQVSAAARRPSPSQPASAS